MPPKKKPSEPSKKTEAKKKDKVIEDKTFGMKNKKGTKQQKFIKMVANQVTQGNPKTSKLEAEKAKLGTLKDIKKKQAEELNALFKPVEQKVGKGVDPKSVVCAFFKQGMCTKGEKCKFSHDLNVGRKGEKRSIYADKREDEDGMEFWDEQKLEEVVNKKHGEKNSSLPQTSIEDRYNGPVKEISLEALAMEAREADGTGSVRTSLPSTSKQNQASEEAGKMDEAGALPPHDDSAGIETNGEILDTPIDENLFDGEDIDIVEEELETLELND